MDRHCHVVCPCFVMLPCGLYPRACATPSSHERSLQASLAALTRPASSAAGGELQNTQVLRTYDVLGKVHCWPPGAHLQNLIGETPTAEAYDKVPSPAFSQCVSSRSTHRAGQARLPTGQCLFRQLSWAQKSTVPYFCT